MERTLIQFSADTPKSVDEVGGAGLGVGVNLLGLLLDANALRRRASLSGSRPTAADQAGPEECEVVRGHGHDKVSEGQRAGHNRGAKSSWLVQDHPLNGLKPKISLRPKIGITIPFLLLTSATRGSRKGPPCSRTWP